ncbi:MAG: hypothetical protein Athens101410_329 [Parcubacteria group bacterium Athens1014_10]|nr:MAG: hypothetical protein Athens101410_329 [Parcubacteria group bacterium Athens1014_10]TSD04216.1 MAG: hypothetical protein Athens071412_780 [Parcubacteria group bacterium Athens0714_12]
MAEFLVVSRWNDDPKMRKHLVEEVTEHPDMATAEAELLKRKKILGERSKVRLVKIIKEL